MNERVKDMNANGVLGALCFPSFPQFCGQLFARTDDKDVALAMIEAYNDWHIDEWCGSHPGRFIPLALPAIWDPETLAGEVRRTAAMGAHALVDGAGCHYSRPPSGVHVCIALTTPSSWKPQPQYAPQ